MRAKIVSEIKCVGQNAIKGKRNAVIVVMANFSGRTALTDAAAAVAFPARRFAFASRLFALSADAGASAAVFGGILVGCSVAIVITGIAHLRCRSDFFFIQKPASIRQILETVRRCLDS